MNSKVLACIDHSNFTPGVCDYAAWAAVRLAAPLEFIHILDRRQETAPMRDLSGSIGLGAQEALLEDLSVLDENRGKIAQESGRLLLEAAKQRAVAAGVPAPEARKRHGDLVETLVEIEQDARMFVLGKRGETGESAPQHIGSNLERVIRAVHRPILIVPKEFQAPRNFLIAFDGSKTTRKGVEMIASSPLFRGLACHILMVDTESPASIGQLEWAKYTLANAGFSVTASIIAGNAETVIAEYERTNQIDLLVMGAYGHSRIRHLLVGSTTTAMIRTSSIPLLLLR
ncbi:MAG: universal stress protein [Oxalobacteraceae bacterium]|nr:universal stress protein [Oxalobacteraceae bacterium]